MAFQYPEHPNTNRPDPFRNRDGKNPFADSEPVAETDSSNHFATSAETQHGAYQPGDYVTSGHGRGGMLLMLGGLGCLASLVASLGVCLALAGIGLNEAFYLFASSGPLLLGAAASWAAWLMARGDLRSMRAGVLPDDTEGRTRVGLYLGIIGTLFAAAPLVVLIVALVRGILDAV